MSFLGIAVAYALRVSYDFLTWLFLFKFFLIKIEPSLASIFQVILFVAIVPMIRQNLQTNHTFSLAPRITPIHSVVLETITNYFNTTPESSSRLFANTECEAEKISNSNVSILFFIFTL